MIPSSQVRPKNPDGPLSVSARSRIPRPPRPKSTDPLDSQSARMLRVVPKTVRSVSRLRKHHRLLATVADTRETGFKIPIVDFSSFLHGNQTEKTNTARQILEGFTSSGFIYLSNVGIDKGTVSNTFAWSKKFFDLPTEEKLKLAWETPESNRGYVAPGREKVSRLLDQDEIGKIRSSNPDLKESIEIGKEPSDNYQNKWPASLPEFRNSMMTFYDTCQNVHLEVLSAIATGLGIAPRHFDKYCNNKDNNLRLLHYPGVPKSVFDNADQARAGAHTDYGTITLLFQDDRGGLEVLSPKGTFVPATPIPETIVVNAGDLLQRWSNDVIKSTEHRVVSPPTRPADDHYPARYSIAYFCNPNWDAAIECLEGCYGDAQGGKDKKYAPINTHEYLVSRLRATY